MGLNQVDHLNIFMQHYINNALTSQKYLLVNLAKLCENCQLLAKELETSIKVKIN